MIYASACRVMVGYLGSLALLENLVRRGTEACLVLMEHLGLKEMRCERL